MRHFLLAAVATAALTGQAFAGDLPSAKGAPVFVAPAPAFSWSGFYVGINGGFGGDRFTYPFALSVGAATAAGQARLNSSGFLGGGQIGYNYQFAGTPYVAGLEADIDGSTIKGQISAAANAAGTTVALNAGSRLDYFGTVRARLGYSLFDRALVYATGGFAYGGLNSFANGSAGGGLLGAGGALGVSRSNTVTGWTVGGGLEYALTNNWSFRTEYLYVDLGTANIASGALLGGTASLGVKTTENIVRAGLNYRFGAPELPIIAKY